MDEIVLFTIQTDDTKKKLWIWNISSIICAKNRRIIYLPIHELCGCSFPTIRKQMHFLQAHAYLSTKVTNKQAGNNRCRIFLFQIKSSQVTIQADSRGP